MTRILIITWIVIVAVARVEAHPDSVTYASEAGRYTVRFPGKPRVKDQIAKSDLGELKVVTATYADSEGDTYLVAYTDFPEGAAKPEARATIYDGARDRLKGDKGKVLAETEIHVGPVKLPGREIEVELDKKRMKFRMVLRDGRLYQVAVLGSSSFVKSRNARQFLESFELTK